MFVHDKGRVERKGLGFCHKADRVNRKFQGLQDRSKEKSVVSSSIANLFDFDIVVYEERIGVSEIDSCLRRAVSKIDKKKSHVRYLNTSCDKLG